MPIFWRSVGNTAEREWHVELEPSLKRSQARAGRARKVDLVSPIEVKKSRDGDSVELTVDGKSYSITRSQSGGLIVQTPDDVLLI